MTRTLALLAACIGVAPDALADEARFTRERAAMVDNIRAQARTISGFAGREDVSEPILQVMGEVKRHLFIPEPNRSIAYADRPVPIGYGQTISQPLIVAWMTQLTEVKPDHTILEIGTGSGYQAAILGKLARKVCSIEIVRPLGENAAAVLKQLGYDNVVVRIGDGYDGWPECGPFDSVIVTAALGHVPPPLIQQLKIGGRVVMPVGAAGGTQQLSVIEKLPDGKTTTRSVGLVRFVPFVRPKN